MTMSELRWCYQHARDIEKGRESSTRSLCRHTQEKLYKWHHDTLQQLQSPFSPVQFLKCMKGKRKKVFFKQCHWNVLVIVGTTVFPILLFCAIMDSRAIYQAVSSFENELVRNPYINGISGTMRSKISSIRGIFSQPNSNKRILKSMSKNQGAYERTIRYFSYLWEPLHQGNDAFIFLSAFIENHEMDKEFARVEYEERLLCQSAKWPINVKANLSSDQIIYKANSMSEAIRLIDSSGARGRLLLLLEDPVSRLESYVSKTKELNNPEFRLNPGGGNESDYIDNPVIRAIVGKEDTSLDVGLEDLDQAKAFLSLKVLIGLSSHIAESFTRYKTFFQWNKDNHIREACMTRWLDKDRKFESSNIEQNNPMFAEQQRILTEKNAYDIMLYDFAVQLYHQQTVLFTNE